MRTLLLVLPLLLFHFYLGLALRALAPRVGAGPATWAFLPGLNLALLFRVAGRSPAWALLLLAPGPNLVAWALVWAEIAARVRQRAWLGLVMALPGPNLPALGRLAGLPRFRTAALTVAVIASLPGAWLAHASALEARVAAAARRLAARDAEGRRRALVELADLGRRALPARPALERALAEEDPALRGQTARTLWCVTGERPDAGRLPVLLEAARGSIGWPLPDASLVTALAEAGRGAAPDLESALADPDPGVRWHAAGAFVRLGRGGAAAVPALLQAMHDPEWNVRNSAGRALEEAVGPEHATRLTQVLAEPSVEMRYHVARALARLGAAASPAVPGLVLTLEDADWEVRMESCWALAAIGPAAAAARPALLRALGDLDAQVRASAAWSLAHTGAGAGVASAIRSLLQDPDRDVRDAAAAVLRRIEAKT